MESELAAVQLDDFLEKNRCKIFIKGSENGDFAPACDSLRVVGSAVTADKVHNLISGSGLNSGRRYFLQLAVFRRGDFARCLAQLFDLSLRKESGAWLLLWILGDNRRFLAKLNADKAIMQGALMHMGFWLTAREDSDLMGRIGQQAMPRWDNLLPVVEPLLGRPPDRLVTVCFAWQPRRTRNPQQQQQQQRASPWGTVTRAKETGDL